MPIVAGVIMPSITFSMTRVLCNNKVTCVHFRFFIHVVSYTGAGVVVAVMVMVPLVGRINNEKKRNQRNLS